MKHSFRLIASLLVAGATAPAFAAQTNTLLSITAPWRYNTNSLNGVNWTAADYDDTAWSGPSNALLYIETDALPATKNTPLPPRPTTSLPFNTYFFRTTFVVSNAPEIDLLVFSNVVDDGAVFYLNGVEIRRLYMPSGTIDYSTPSSSSHEASTYDIFDLNGDALTNLVEGTNLLAAEVHQTSDTSSDVVFGTSVTEARGFSPSLTRGPYLQLSTPTSIVIRWRTDIGTTSRVIYGTNLAAPDLTNTSLASVGEHIITLTNLLPDTKYFYSIGSATTNLSPASINQFFLTHPLPGTPKPLRVWVIGDAGTANANQVAVRNAFQTYNGTNIVHAWLQLGDNAYETGTDVEYQNAVFKIYTNQLRTSVTWPTLGNHDTAQGTSFLDTYPYFAIFTLPTTGEAGGVPSATEHYYSFDLGMVHFICLDSMTADRSTNGAMATWLRSDLAANTNRWLVAYWHHPPYTKGSHNSDSETALLQMRANFLPLLEAGGVDLVLAGHSHSYERSFFINGHYGLSTSFSTNLIVQTGGGRETNGVGAYLKHDTLGWLPAANRGAVYAVAGSSGKTSGGPLNHPAMFFSTNALGSLILDFNSNRLDVTFLRETSTLIDDYFTLIKDNQSPTAKSAAYARCPGLALTISRTNLLASFVTDADDDPLFLTEVGSSDHATVTTNATSIFYLPNDLYSTNTDNFSYTVTDGHGGITTTNLIVAVSSFSSCNSVVSLLTDTPGTGTNTLTFTGIPGFEYVIQFATNLPAGPWFDLATNLADTNGLWMVIDPTATNTERFYRSKF